MRGNQLKNRLKTFFSDKLFTAFFVLTLLLILGALILMAFPKSSLFYKAINSVDTTSVGEHYDGEELVLEFVSPKDYLTGITFKMSAYDRDPSAGTLNITLSGEDGTIVYSQDKDIGSMKEKSQLTFKFAQIALSKNVKYAVHFKTSGVDKTHAITLLANDNVIDDVSTTLSGIPCATPVFTLQYVLAVPYYNLRYAFDLSLAAAVLYVLTVAAYGRNRAKTDPSEK